MNKTKDLCRAVNNVLDNRQLKVEICNNYKALRLVGRGQAVECEHG